MHDAITRACEATVDWAAATWQNPGTTLPLSKPLPARATLRRYRYGEQVIERHFRQPLDALIAALHADDDYPIVVHGGAGSGKSAALRWTAGHLAQAALDTHRSDQVPVFLDLGQVNGDFAEASFSDCLKRHLNSTCPIDYRDLRKTDSALVFLLDGLDLPLKHHPPVRILKDLANHQSDRRHRFIISTRYLDDVVRLLDDWPTSQRIELGPLDAHSRHEWLCQTLSTKQLDRFCALWGSGPLLPCALDVPLFFSMAVAMALNEHDHDWRRQLRRYPGRAGVLHAFLDCIVHRAWVGQRLPRNVHLYELSPIIERLSFAAWMRAPTDRIPVAHVQDLLADSDFAEQRLVPVEAARAWQNAQDVALRVGILLPSETHGDYRFPHQQFCEYFAGRHFATRLRLAAKRRCFDAELWELLGVRHHDSVTSYALEVLAGDPKGQQLVTRAFRILSSSDDDASLSFIARVGGGLAYNWLVGPATREGASLPALNALAELGGTSACNALKSMADDLTRSCEDRWAATAALCRVAPALGMENLKQLWGEFQDSQPDGAWFMIAYLITEVDYDASASFLEQLARAGTTPALLRVRIMTHLLAHGHIAAPAMLAELAQDSGVSPVLRRAALGPLFESQPEAGHALIPALRKQEGELTDIDRHEIAQLHMQVDAALAMDLLEEVCRDRWASVHVRVDAASDLVRADPMRGARCLRDMCEDTHDHYLCLSAARALAQGDEHSATRVLETLYEDEAIELRWRVRAASILSDVKSGWTVPYERLRTWLADGTDVSAQDICALTRVWHARVVMDCKISPTVRRLVLQDWVRAAGRSVADTLRRLSGTRDEHPDVRKAAIEALVRLQGDAIGPFMLKLIEEEDNEAVRQALVGECISLVPEDVLVRVFAERTRARGAQEKQWIRHAKEWGGAVSSGKIEWSRIEHVAKGTNVSTDILNVMASHAGRRVLSPTYAEKIGPQVQERERLLAAPTSAAGATHTKRMNKELVMAMYLVDCTNHGRQPTLRDAEVWSQEFGQPWKRSALRETEPWKRHMSTVGSREEYKRDIMKALLHSWREEE